MSYENRVSMGVNTGQRQLVISAKSVFRHDIFRSSATARHDNVTPHLPQLPGYGSLRHAGRSLNLPGRGRPLLKKFNKR
jgi:hypothetical protein